MTAYARGFAVGVSFGVVVQDIAPTAVTNGVVEAYLGSATDRADGGDPAAQIDISGAGPLTVQAFSDIDATARVEGGAGALAVTVNAYRPTAEAGGATRAFAGGGIDLQGPDLRLLADGDAMSDATLFSLSLAGAAAVNVLKPTARTNNEVEAYLGHNRLSTSTDQLNINIDGSVDIDAVADSVANATSTGVAVALGAGVSDVEAEATLAGGTRAYVGPNTTVTAVNVDLDADERTAAANSNVVNGGGGLIAGISLLESSAYASRQTDAFVGNNTTLVLSGNLDATADTTMASPMSNATIDSVNVAGVVGVSDLKATSVVGANDAMVDATDSMVLSGSAGGGTVTALGTDFREEGFAVGQVVTISGLSGTWTIAEISDGSGTNAADNVNAVLHLVGGALLPNSTQNRTVTGTAPASATRAFTGANADITAASADFDADANTEAAATVNSGSGAGIADIAITKIEASGAHDTEATVGNGTEMEIAGALTLTADAVTLATPVSSGLSIAGAVSYGSTDVITEVDSDTTAAIGDGVDITAGSIRLDADADHNVAATADLTSGSLIVSISDLEAISRDKGSVNVRIGNTGTGATLTTTSGNIDADAKLTSDVDAASDASGFSLVAAGNVTTKALNQAQANARIGNDVDITSAGRFDMQAMLIGDAVGAASVTNGGLVANSVSRTDVDFDASVNFTTGTGGSIDAAQSINLVALLNHDGTNQLKTANGRGAIGSGNNITGGLVANSKAEIDVDADSMLTLTVGQDLNLTTDTTINIEARHVNEAFSTLSSRGGGAVSVSNGDVDANTNSTTTVAFEGDVGTTGDEGASGFSMIGEVRSVAEATMTSGSGGIADIASATADARSNGTLNMTFAGLGTVMNVGESGITAQANLLTDADTSARSAGGGAVRDSNVKTDSRATGSVNYTVGNSDSVVTTGDVTLTATHGGAGSNISDGTVAGSSAGANTIDFSAPHLLQDGANVVFTGTTQGGLQNGKEYTVIRTDTDTIQLGARFGSGAVDTAQDTITIPLHAFEDGDQVIYNSNSGDLIDGLGNGTTYQVKVIDEDTIKLQTVGFSETTTTVSRDNIDTGADTISGLGGIPANQPVTYRPEAAKLFGSNLVDVRVDNPTTSFDIVFDGLNRIFIQNHGFSIGDEVVYRASGGTAIGGLVDGATYFIAGGSPGLSGGSNPTFTFNSDYIRLANSLEEATGFTNDNGTPGDTMDDFWVQPSVINVVRDTSDEARQVEHSLREVEDEPIGGLTEGNSYYVVGGNQLSLTQGGPAINLFLTGPATGGTHEFVAEGVDLQDGGPGSGQTLVVNLTSSSISGVFDGVGGAGGFAAPSADDGVVTASGSGAGGGLIQNGDAETKALATVTTNLTVAGGAAIKGANVTIATDSALGAASTADGGGGGGISLGGAKGDADGRHTTSLTVGENANIEATGNIDVTTRLKSNVVSHGESSQGGLFASATGDADSRLEYGTKITIDGKLIAGGTANVATRVDSNVDAEARAYGGGLGANTDIDADAVIVAEDGFVGSQIQLLNDADVQGNDVILSSQFEKQRARSYTDTTAGGAGGRAVAESDSTIRSANEVLLENGSNIVGNESILIEAEYSQTSNTSRARAALYAIGGKTSGDAESRLTNAAKVEGMWEATLTTARLDVDVVDFNRTHTASGNGTGVFIGPKDDRSETGDLTLDRDIFWEAHVFLLGEPNPELVVNEDGVIEKIVNVNILGITGETVGTDLSGLSQIVVDDLIYDEAGKAEFFANDISGHESRIWGNRGVFEIERTWSKVRIVNESELDLVMNIIDPVLDSPQTSGFNPADVEIRLNNVPGPVDSPPNNVSLDRDNRNQLASGGAANPTFEFDVLNNWQRTIIDLLNLQTGATAASDIILDGWIQNPIGVTNIRNERGNILADTDADIEVIRTNEIDLDAIGGSIGTVGDVGVAVGSNNRTPISIELVRFQDADLDKLTPSLTAGAIFNPDIEADATGDLVLDLGYMDRADDTAGGDDSQTATIRHLEAGDDVSVVVNDMREGIGMGVLGVLTVADRANNDLRTVANHFRPDEDPGPDYMNILRAFGTDFAEIDATWDFTLVRAGDDIDIGHVNGDAVGGEPRSYATTSIGGSPYGSSAASDTPDTTVNFIVNTDVNWSGGSSDDGVEQIFLTTDGDITATEVSGSMLVGHIHSTQGDVTLFSPRYITDADGAVTVDVTGNNITMTSGTDNVGGGVGGIGARTDFLEINTNRNGAGGDLDAYDTSSNVTSRGIFLDEIVGEMPVGQVFSKADVSLRTVAGAILESVVDFADDVRGQSVDIDANGGSIGTASSFLDIDSSRGSPAPTGTSPGGDDVALEATGGIYVDETDGYLRLVLAHSYTGDISLSVRESADLDEDLILVESGSARFAESNDRAPSEHMDADRIIDNGTIFAERGSVTARVGDDVITDDNSDILAAEGITIVADPFDFDAGFGSDIILRGRIIAGADVTEGDESANATAGDEMGTAVPTFTAPQFTTQIFGGTDVDLVQFGDETGSAGTTTQGQDGYIFLGSKTQVFGDEGEDDIKVYYLQDTATVTSPAQLDALTALDQENAEHTLRLDGQDGTDTYEVFTLGSNGPDARNYIINVLDTGASDDGVDELFIYGNDSADNGIDPNTDEAYPADDIFLLRQSAFIPNETADRPGYVALVHGDEDTYRDVTQNNETSAEVQRIGYDSALNGRLTVLGLGGNDAFFTDDTSVITTLDGGEGNDRFQIGQIFGLKRNEVDGNLLPQDAFPNVVATTRGFLSAGTNAPLLAHGGSGADEFTVYSNQAELRLEGDDGNDIFTVRAFALALVDSNGDLILDENGLPQPIIGANGFSIDRPVDVRTGGGNDEVRYNVNAPVSIEGGTGFDKVVILGTEFADDFVITDEGILGAGLNVRYDTIEVIEVDGLEGDDEFFVQSTAFGVSYRVIGGLGSDTINVAGDVTEDIVTLELEGASGAVNHLVTSDDLRYDGLLVDGFDYNVPREDTGLVVIEESDGFTSILEGGGETATDSYTVRLAEALVAGQVVYVTVSGARSTQEEQDGTLFNPSFLPGGVGDSFWLSSTAPADPMNPLEADFQRTVTVDGANQQRENRALVLRFDHTNWDQAQEVHLFAVDDLRAEGDLRVVAQHSVIAENADQYDGIAVRNVEVDLRDNDTPGVQITEIDATQYLDNGTIVEDQDTTVIEGDATTQLNDLLAIQLAKAPAMGSTVVVNLNLGEEADKDIKLSSADGRFQIVDGVAQLTFTDGDWDDPVIVIVEARDDARVEDPGGAVIAVDLDAANTTDPSYIFPNLRSGNGLLEVNVLDNDSAGALVQESGGSTLLAPTDDYTIRLTGAPTADVDVAILTDGLANVVGIGDGMGNITAITADDYVAVGGLRAVQQFQGQVVAENNTITRDGVAQSFGSFIDEGFTAGQQIRVENLGADFDGDYIIASVSDLTITLTEAFAGAGSATSETAVLSDLARIGFFEGTVSYAPDAGGSFDGEQLIRSDGSGWLADGFLEGQWIRVTDQNNPANEIELKVELIRGDNDNNDEKLQFTATTALPGWLSSGSTDVRIERIAASVSFDDTDYWMQKTVVLEADSDFDVPITREGSKVFAATPHLLSNLRGPLQVEGGVTGADRSLQNGLKLPGEADDFLFAIGEQPPESQQIDVLNIFNDSSVENGEGLMTETTLTGFGMADTLDFGPSSANDFGEPTVVPGGISWGRITLGGGGFDTSTGESTIEVVNVMLGEGNDTLDVTGTLNNVTGIDTTGEFTITPAGDGNGGTISRDGIDWLALGFLPGQIVQIEGQTGQWTVESIDDAVINPLEGADPNDNSILVLSGDPLPVLTGEITVIGIDALVETIGTFAVTTNGTETRVTRNDGVTWEDDNFIIGHLVRVQGDGQDQSVRLIDIEDNGATLVLENATLSDSTTLDLELSVQGPHGGLTVLHGGGNRPLELCVDLDGQNVEGGVELTRLDGLDWIGDGYKVGDYIQLEGESETRQILDILDAAGPPPADAFQGWGEGAVLVLDGGDLTTTGLLEDAKIHVAKPAVISTEVTLDLDCCDKGEGVLELVSADDWAALGFEVGQLITIEGLPGTAEVLSIDGNTLTAQYDRIGITVEGTVTVSAQQPRLDGGILVGGDTFTVTGGAGPDSPLVIYGDTSQDGNWYAGQPFSVLGYDLGEKPFDPFPELPDGDNEDDEWVMPLANPFDHFGNDVIDASALFAGLSSDNLPSVGITAYGGGGDDVIIGSQAGDHLAGGSGNDAIFGLRGTDHIYGDSGVNVDILTRALYIATDDQSPLPTVDPSIQSDGTTLQPAPSPVRDSLIAGNDTIFGDGPDSTDGGADAPEEQFRDLIFGDHGEVIMTVEDPNLPPILLQRIQTTDLALVTEVIGVGSDNGGNDVIFGGEGRDILMGGAGDDVIETGQLQNLRDIAFGDNGRVTLNGSETFDAPSDADVTGEEYTILSFNFDSRPGQATVDGVAGTNDSISTNGAPAPRADNWMNFDRSVGVWGDEAGEFITDENGTHHEGIVFSWRQKNDDLPIYNDPDRTDGFGYTDADYDGRDLLWDETDYKEDARFNSDERARFDAHNQITNNNSTVDDRLFEGYMNVKRRDTIEIVVEGLDAHFSEYDVYVYIDADDGQTPNSGEAIRIVSFGPDNRYYLSDPEGVHFEGQYIQATSTDPNAPTQGNYVAHSGFTDGRLVIELSVPADAIRGARAAIAGFQIVGTSHPIDRAESVDAEVGGNDAIYTGGGDDLVFGGTGSDWIDTAGDADVGHLDYDAVFGDNGRATLVLTQAPETYVGGDIGELRTMESITVADTFNMNDIIITGNGQDVVIGGQGEDCIETGDDGIHNAVDDALSGDDVVSVGINFVAGLEESFVEGTLGYVAADGWNNLDNGSFTDPSTDADGIDNETGFKTTDPELFTTAEGISLLVGRNLESDNPRNVGRDVLPDFNPDTQNGRLFNGYLKGTFGDTLGIDVSQLDQHFGEAQPYDVYLYVPFQGNRERFSSDIVLIDENGIEHTVEMPRHAEFDGLFDIANPSEPLSRSNVVVFRDVIGDDFKIRILGEDEGGYDDRRNRPSISAMQIVGGADKDEIVPQGDHDSDRVLGDQGMVRLLDRDVFEMASQSRGIDVAGDMIMTGDDGDVVVGGDGADFIHTDDGDDVTAGDNARVRLFDGEVIQINVADEAKRNPSALVTSPDFDPFAATGLQLIDPASGWGDVIEGGRGDDWAWGGAGDDNYVFAGERLGSDSLVEAGIFPANDSDPDDNGDGIKGTDVPDGLLNDTGDLLDFSGYDHEIYIRLQNVEMRSYNTDVILGDENGALRLFSADAFEDVVGSEFDDKIRANDRNNAIMGLGGDDTLMSGAGNDFADGGDGDDTIWMGLDADDEDFVVAGADAFTQWFHIALGGAGNDDLFLSNGIDLVDGEEGNDLILGGGADGEPGFLNSPSDLLFGGDGIDRIRGGRGIDTIVGGDGPDDINGSQGDVEVAQNLDPAVRDALIADMLTDFSAAFGRSDFVFVPANGEPLRDKVEPFIDTIPAPEKCPEPEMVALTAAAAAEELGVPAALLSVSEAQAGLAAARTLWEETGQLSDSQIAMLNGVTIEITDLDGLVLAQTDGEVIRIDANAAGHGWFVDVGPESQTQFETDAEGVLRAKQGSDAEVHMDLLSTLSHELGHALGYDHIEGFDPSHVMNETLDAGTRFDEPATLVFDEVSGEFVDPDTARGLESLSQRATGSNGYQAPLALNASAAPTSSSVQWGTLANALMSRLGGLFRT
ncbi:MAG: hypothetical protein AAF216_01205 [Pseudomonadota bacterium]